MTYSIKNGLYVLASTLFVILTTNEGRTQTFLQHGSAIFNNNLTDGWNAAWVDLNGDGFDDLYLMEYANNTRNHVYINNGNGAFTEDFSTEALINKVAGSLSSTWADIDNDGDRDVHVANHSGGPNFLITNNGDGTFTDNTGNLNSSSVGFYHGSSWADYDNDGYVDLFTCSFKPSKYSELFHNNGDGSFTQVFNDPIAELIGRSIGPSWADYDNDGWPDLFVPNGNGQNNALFHNMRNGTFERISDGDIVNDGSNSVASCWGDIDNDGDLDLFVANTSNHNNLLYFNNGDGTFTKELNSPVVTSGGQSHGSHFVDYDNDADLDLFICNTEGQANTIFINDGTGEFTALTDSVFCYDDGFPYSQAWSDFDKDGDMDVFICNIDSTTDRLLVNAGNSNHWIQLKLKGTNSNFSAIGAKVKVKAGGVWQMREVNSQSGFGSQNSLHQHFGLGAATIIDSIKIIWPSGYRQFLTNIATNQFLSIEEDNSASISGTVFHDMDDDCAFTSSEATLSNIRLTVTPGNIHTATNSAGQFTLNLTPGTYRITCENPEYWTTDCDSSITIIIDSVGQQVAETDFGKKPLVLGPDLYINFAATPQRRGFNNSLLITYGNKGTTTDYNRWIEMKIPDGVYIKQSSLPWVAEVNNVYLWHFDSIVAGQTGSFILTDSIGLERAVGDCLLFHSNITTFQDLNTLNDVANKIEVVVGALDPNDITVSPRGFGENGVINRKDTLTYRIRFQNVGSARAQNVFIRDVLPDELDPSTVTMLNMSHEANFQVVGNTIIWEFNNINLPDSTTDEPGSHGYLFFKILPKKNVVAGAEINNRAVIEFDYEVGIITNTTLNTIQYPNNNNYNTLEIYPNPVRNSAVVRLKRNNQIYEDPVDIREYRVMELSGKTVQRKMNLKQCETHLDASLLPRGVYVILATDANGMTHSRKFVATGR